MFWKEVTINVKLVESGGGVVSTESALGALAEQLAIAATLRKLQHGADGQLIDAAINEVRCSPINGLKLLKSATNHNTIRLSRCFIG